MKLNLVLKKGSRQRTISSLHFWDGSLWKNTKEPTLPLPNFGESEWRWHIGRERPRPQYLVLISLRGQLLVQGSDFSGQVLETLPEHFFLQIE
jgi:hypothetical protein